MNQCPRGDFLMKKKLRVENLMTLYLKEFYPGVDVHKWRPSYTLLTIVVI
jgi:hypothetical protein